MTFSRAIIAGLVVLGLGRAVCGQSSSLFVRAEQAEQMRSSVRATFSEGSYGETVLMNQSLAANSLISVELPEPRKFRVHDLITIIVREKKKYESDADTEQGKDVSLKAKLAKWFRIHNQKWAQQVFGGGTPEVDFSLGSKWEGDGKVEREDQFTTRITAEVIDVKPNGNLVLQARKHIRNDEERQVVTLTGICRSMDVSADNTVLSTQLADLEIDVSHSGAVRDATRRGWIPRFFDFLRPF